MTPSAWVLLLPYFPGGKCIQTGVSKSELGDGVGARWAVWGVHVVGGLMTRSSTRPFRRVKSREPGTACLRPSHTTLSHSASTVFSICVLRQEGCVLRHGSGRNLAPLGGASAFPSLWAQASGRQPCQAQGPGPHLSATHCSSSSFRGDLHLGFPEAERWRR